jgi:ParB family chromosome partitioning protein
MAAKAPPRLAESDLTPLLQATASRSLDTCLRGARGLAVLGDPRAFGLLLQLSREEDALARVEVCRALAALNDPRGIRRLRSLLFDPEPAVRDAAFTALARLQATRPLESAEAGLNAAFEDVRRRGLEELLNVLRQSKGAREGGPALELLGRTLNDSFPSVRGEAFKAVLNLPVADGGVRALRFALQSVHADVRREVLTEVTAQLQQDWAWNLLLEFYNDADARLREEAFNFAVRKNKDLPPLEAALLSQYPDVRRLGVDALIKKHTAAAQALLIKALHDPNKDVRQRALGALVGEDAQAPLTKALENEHPDIRVRAACALVRHGSREALAPLLALATAPEPPQRERQADWLALSEEALTGLADLGDSEALGPLMPLLNSEHASQRKLAAAALAWTALPNHPEPLRQALQHSDPQVKYHAALGLAYCGDPLVGSLAFSTQAAEVLTPGERLVGAFMLGAAGEDQLGTFLDDPDDKLRGWALLLLLIRDLADRQGAPVRCLACLAARPPRVRLTAARALENFADPAAFRDLVVQILNDRGDEPAWKIPVATVDALGELLTRGSPAARARTAHLMVNLFQNEHSAWDQAWKLHASRYAGEVDSLKKAAKKREAPALQYTPEQLQEMAFGAYVGLVREQGGASAAGRGTEAQVIRVRQTALSRIHQLAAGSGHYAEAARPVLVQALGDPNQAVRLQAFDHLVALKVDTDTLAAAALGAGHTDVGVRGLEAMAGGGTTEQGQAVLEDALRTRTDDLATEAAKLLAARRGLVPVAGVALGAAYEPLRKQAVAWLAEEYDRSPEARDLLRQALQSRYRWVMSQAALELATKKDPAAFDALVQLLKTTDEGGPQRRIIEALKGLGDPRAIDAFLDRIENDPEGTALVKELFAAAGDFRRPESVDRLLRMGEKAKWSEGMRAAFVVSGFDQPIEDPEDESGDRRWEEKQAPRHVGILARMLQRAMELKANDNLRTFLPAARWARGPEVDPALANLAFYADTDIRNSTVEAIGWRLRKRKGPADTLVKLLSHRDPNTQMLAAEGLARGSRGEGLSVLMAAVDLQTDPGLQSRAVRALGELGDARAYDLLNKIANDPEHSLRQEAIEAIGHLGRSTHADDILRMLLPLARQNDPSAMPALRGLRWLDHPDGWQLILRRAQDKNLFFQNEIVELLGHHDEPGTRDVLMRILAETENETVFEAALKAARRLWGGDSLEPDYAGIRNRNVDRDALEDLFNRLRERGDARRLLEILPLLADETAATLQNILLARRPLPIAEARAILGGSNAAAAGVAAVLLGRADPDPANGKAVAEALARWWKEYDRSRQEETRRGAVPGSQTQTLVTPLQNFIWAAGRLGDGGETLLAIASARPEQAFDRPLRRQAVNALTEMRPTPAILDGLERLAVGDDPEVRVQAAETVARADPARRPALAGKVLGDRLTFNRIAARDGKDLTATLRGAIVQVHNQGTAIPHLVAQGDVEGLAAVADNGGFSEEVRLGAVEGLAALASEAAEAELVRIGQSTGQPEELRKAAWRGRRRSKRARQRAAKRPQEAS